MPILQEALENAKKQQRAGHYEVVEKNLTRCIEAAENEKDPLVAALYNQRGITRRMLGKWDDALHDYKLAIRNAEDTEQVALGHINIADIHRVAKSDFAAALTSIDDAISLAENGSLTHAKALDQRGLVFSSQKEYPESIESYVPAQTICEKLLEKGEDIEVLDRYAQILNHLAVAYVFRGNHEDLDFAEEAQKKALRVFARTNNQQGLANSYVNLGRIALIEGDAVSASFDYHRALTIISRIGPEKELASIYLHLAEALLVQSLVPQAVDALSNFCYITKKGQITAHDISIMKPRFEHVAEMYDKAKLGICGFNSTRELFAAQ